MGDAIVRVLVDATSGGRQGAQGRRRRRNEKVDRIKLATSRRQWGHTAVTALSQAFRHVSGHSAVRVRLTVGDNAFFLTSLAWSPSALHASRSIADELVQHQQTRCVLGGAGYAFKNYGFP